MDLPFDDDSHAGTSHEVASQSNSWFGYDNPTVLVLTNQCMVNTISYKSLCIYVEEKTS